MKIEYIDRMNKLIERFIISDERMRPKGVDRFEYNTKEKKSYYIMAADEKELYALTNDIINNDSQLKNTLSIETAMREMLILIEKCKREQRYTDNREFSAIINEIRCAFPITEYEVFHGISGISISSSAPMKIGRFTFYQLPYHQKEITEEYHPGVPEDDIIPLIDQLAQYETWVSVKVSARDLRMIEQLADEMFDRLQNLLRYLVSYLEDYRDIGIFNYRELAYDNRIMMTKGSGTISHSAVPGSMECTEIDTLFSQCEEHALNPRELIKYIGDEGLSEMRKRLLTAVDLYGRAFHDAYKSIGFLEGMMAIESLLQMNVDALVNQSVSAQISEYCAFLLGANTEERLRIEDTVKKLYSIRSKLAHGNVSSINTRENSEVLMYARSLIEMFIVDETLSQMKSKGELREHIQQMKYR